MKNRIYILLSILTLVFACKTDNTVNTVTSPTIKPTVAVSQSVSPIPSLIPTPSSTPCILPAVTPTPRQSPGMPPLPVIEGTKANVITSGGLGIMAISDKGDFVIAWTTRREPTKKEIYARVFKSNGISTTCEEFKLTEFSNNINFDLSPLGINFDKEGNFTIIYHIDKHVYMKKFNQNGKAIGNELKVTDMTNYTSPPIPDIDFSSDGSFVISWTEYDGKAGGMPKSMAIHAKKFDINGKSTINEFIAEIENKDSGGHNAIVKFDSNGNYFVLWNDKKNLFISKISSDGNVKYNKVKIASDVDGHYTEFSQNSDHNMIIDKNNNLIISYFGNSLCVLVLSNNLEIIKPELNVLAKGFGVMPPINSLITDKDNNLYMLFVTYKVGITLKIFDELFWPVNNGKVTYNDPSLNIQRESMVYNEKTGVVILSDNLYFRRFDSFGNEIK